MKCEEYFSGFGDIAKEGRTRGHTVNTLDWDNHYGADRCIDILTCPDDDLQGKSYGHFSPDCRAYSVASISTHWTGGKGAYIPKSSQAKVSIQILDKMANMIAYRLKQPERFVFTIENPRGVMRKVIFGIFKEHGIDLKMSTAWYCQYGDSRAKPTDIFHNMDFLELKTCKNYRYDKETGEIIDKHCHHEQARRGAKTGTQGLEKRERSRIPKKLIKALWDAVEKELSQ